MFGGDSVSIDSTLQFYLSLSPSIPLPSRTPSPSISLPLSLFPSLYLFLSHFPSCSSSPLLSPFLSIPFHNLFPFIPFAFPLSLSLSLSLFFFPLLPPLPLERGKGTKNHVNTGLLGQTKESWEVCELKTIWRVINFNFNQSYLKQNS